MKRKLVTILIGCMALGLFGCGSGLSDTTKRLTPQQSEDSEQNANHTGNEDQQAEVDTTEKKMAARKRPLVTVTVSLP